MTTLDPLPDGTAWVCRCPDCDNSLAVDEGSYIGGARIEHHSDGSHTFHPAPAARGYVARHRAEPDD
jgi:hypothetical protein